MTVYVVYENNVVIDAAEGRPTKAALSLFFSSTAKTEAAPDGVGLGWRRASDGTYSAPPEVVLPPEQGAAP